MKSILIQDSDFCILKKPILQTKSKQNKYNNRDHNNDQTKNMIKNNCRIITITIIMVLYS